MDFPCTPEQAALKARAATYVQQLMQYEDQAAQAGGLLPAPLRELARAAIGASLYAINMPAEWGGLGLSLLDQVIVEEEFGTVHSGLWDLCWRPASVLAYCTKAQREKYLLPVIRGERFEAFAVAEPGARRNSGSATTAERTAGGWLLEGKKWFVTRGHVADFLIVQADAGPQRTSALFFVDIHAPGVQSERMPRSPHATANGTSEFCFTEVFVSDDDVLGGIGNGNDLIQEWLTAERLMIAARATGGAQRALEHARTWAGERGQSGSAADLRRVQAMLADCAVDVAANRAYTRKIAWEADQSRAYDRPDLPARQVMGKPWTNTAGSQIVSGRGHERTVRDECLAHELRVDRIWEGACAIQRLITASELLKRGSQALASPRP
uniref:Acyl-CoA/acyl-ACP dehydrogenase n=1 Tax=Streptomyces sp. NBC_00180 TaxID=2903632 RepID=A0AAU1I9E9_9ACTN